MNWKPGDMAIVKNCGTAPEYNGEIVHIKSYPYLCNKTLTEYLVDISPLGVYCKANVVVLFPIDYDGYDTTSWDDCVWKPKELVRVDECTH
jgi:hypothetical protein